MPRQPREGRAELAVLRDRIVECMLRRIEMWLGYGVDGLFFHKRVPGEWVPLNEFRKGGWNLGKA